jgi:hypothetical protein
MEKDKEFKYFVLPGITGDTKVVTAFPTLPSSEAINDAYLKAKAWSEMNPGKHAWLMVDDLSVQPIDKLPGLEERAEIIGHPEIGTASFNQFPNHVCILDDMAQLRDTLVVNWTASRAYVAGGGSPGYLVGGNILLVSRHNDA